MARLFDVQTNFTAGLLDAFMGGRIDTKSYRNGADVLENWVQFAQGGIQRRPGFNIKHDFGIASSVERYRLIPFIFSETQKYVFAIRNNAIDIFDEDGSFLQTLAVPSGFANVPVEQHRWAQRGDVMVLTHNDYSTRLIKRTSATTFSIETFAFDTADDGEPLIPFLKLVASSITVTPSSDAGAGTLTASSAAFAADHVGLPFKIKGNFRLISGFTSSTVVNFTVPSYSPGGIGTSATADWAEPAFSLVAGYARAVAFHGQRLWFSGADSAPAHLFGSKTGEFFNFDVGTALDNESVQGSVATNQVNEIAHLSSLSFLFIFTDIGVNYLPETNESPVTPSTYNPRGIARQGATRGSEPFVYDDTMIYAQIGRRSIRKVFSDEFTNRVKSESVTLITNESFTNLSDSTSFDVFPTRPEQYAYLVMDNGSLAVYHAITEENLTGWSIWKPPEGYNFISVVALIDSLFAVVEGTYWTGSVLEPDQALIKLDTEVTLDSSQVVEVATATNLFAVNDRYRGLTVDVVIDSDDGTKNQYYLGTVATTESAGQTWVDICNCTGGNPTITTKRMVVGFSYLAQARMLPPIYELENGAQLTEPKRIVSATVDVEDTLSLSVEDIPLIVREAGDGPLSTPTPLNDLKRTYNLGWDRRGRITIKAPDPLACTILSVTREVAF